MWAINFKEAKQTYTKEGCVDLPALCINGEIISLWTLTFKERLKVLFGKNIWLHIMGSKQPPVYLSVDNPFKDK